MVAERRLARAHKLRRTTDLQTVSIEARYQLLSRLDYGSRPSPLTQRVAQVNCVAINGPTDHSRWRTRQPLAQTSYETSTGRGPLLAALSPLRPESRRNEDPLPLSLLSEPSTKAQGVRRFSRREGPAEHQSPWALSERPCMIYAQHPIPWPASRPTLPLFHSSFSFVPSFP